MVFVESYDHSTCFVLTEKLDPHAFHHRSPFFIHFLRFWKIRCGSDDRLGFHQMKKIRFRQEPVCVPPYD